MYIQSLTRQAALKAFALALLLLGFACPAARAQSIETLTNSINAFEALLAGVPAQQEFVYVGDMGFRPAYLRNWTAQLRRQAGLSAPSGPTPYSSFDPRVAMWTGGVVPYAYHSSMTPALITEFEGAIYAWQQVSNLKFIPYTGEANYILVVNSGPGGPANSQVGMVGGAQTININTDYPQVDFEHEIGHAMGMLHEQSRSDRDTYVKLHWENFKASIPNPQANVNFAILTNSFNVGSYDYDSIMEYPRNEGNTGRTPGDPTCSDPGCTQIEPLEPYYSLQGSPTLGQTAHLSVGDKAAMAGRYGAPRILSGHVVNGAGAPFAGVTVSISGGTSYRGPAAVMTDTNGNYRFTAIANNSGTFAISASFSGHGFTPAGWNITVGTSDATTLNFSDSDNSPPLVAVASPADGSATTLLTNISGTASDIGSGLQGNQIHFTLFNNVNFWSGAYWTNTVATDPSILLTASVVSGAWTFTNVPAGGAQVQGTYYVSVFARDNAGNLSTPQSGVTSTSFTIDTAPPNVAITFPPEGSTITNQLAGNWFQGIAGDGPGNNLTLTLFIRRNSDNLYWTGSGWGDVTNGLISNTYNSGNQTWQSTGGLPVPGSSLANGDYHFIAIARDAAGNQQQVDSVVSVDFHPVFVFTAGSLYDNDPNNNNLNWNNPANWDVGQVPTADSIVVINSYALDNTALGSLNFYRLDLSGGSLATLGMTLQKVNLSGGTLAGPITIAANGVFNWSGGYLGNCTLPGTATLNVTGTGDKALAQNSTLNLRGKTVWAGTGNLDAAYGCQINNTGTFSIQSDAQLYNYTGGAPSPVFNNTGLIQKTNATGVTVISPANGGWIFNNSGTLDIESGVLSSQTQFYLNNGTVFAGAGVTRVDAGSATLAGTNTLQAGATFELAGGTVSGTNTFAGTGALNWSGGTIAAALSLQSNVVFNLSGAGDKTLAPNSTINTAGSVSWTGAGQINVGYGSVFNNTGSFVAQNDAQFYNNTSGSPLPLFINAGSFTKTNSTGTTAFIAANGGIAFNNNGSVSVQSGALTLGGGGTSANDSFTVATGSLIDFTAGAFVFNGSRALLGGGTNRVNGATVMFNNGTNTMGGANTFEIAAGSVAGTNTFSGAGTVNWSGGSISAALSLQSNIAVNISGAYTKTLAAGGTIAVAGNTLWTGGGDINVSYASALTNNGTFNVQSGAQFYNYTAGAPVPIFVNNGMFLKSTIAATTTFNAANGGVAFHNSGTINVQAGDLMLGGGGAGANGICTAAAGSHIDLTGGGFNWSGNSVISGAGVTRVNGATLTFGGGSTTVNGTFEVAAGSAGGTNTFAGGGALNWTSGALFGNLTLQSNLTFNISVAGDKTLQANSTINNAGTATWSGSGNLNMGYASAINNSGTFIAQNDMQFFNYTGGAPAPVFNNTGTFRKSGSTGQTGFHPSNGGVNFNNTGVVDLRSGTLVIWAGYATSSSNQLKVAIGGLSAGTQSGNEYFYGEAAFDGTLGISLTNGFTPTNGNSFIIATYASRTGQFTSTQFPPLPAASKWQLTYNLTSLVLQVVPSTAFQSFSLTNGNFQSAIVGQAGSMCLIEASTNLLNWAPLLTNSPFNGSLQFVDPQTQQFPRRFYRATISP